MTQKITLVSSKSYQQTIGVRYESFVGLRRPVRSFLNKLCFAGTG